MTTGVLGYVVTATKIMLAKPVSASRDRWNGVGGLVSIGDSSASALRRFFEALGSKPALGQPMGEVLYHHPVHGNWKVIAYRIDEYVGEPTSTAQLEVGWFPIAEVPFDQMWPGDALWITKLIEGHKFQAEIWFDEHDKVRQKDIQVPR
jgi:ADP-ribose pyrophosphatase YjhB (NUDIX family)